MLQRSAITFLLAGAMLVSIPQGSLQAASDGDSKKSSTTTKKKSTTATATKKKSDDDDSDSVASSGKKGSGLDLPLPSKKSGTASGSAATPAPKKSTSKTEKADDETAKPSSTTGKSGASAEKAAAEKEKKQVEDAPAEDKPAGTKAADPTAKREHAPNATVEPEAITEFAAQSPRIQQLMRGAIDLTRQNLTYTFGSADPEKGGMDCSGTMYHLLRAQGFGEVPRDSAGQYLWARKSGAFFPVVSKSAESPEFSELRPGDLMFWTGTYDTQRDVPISHVMLYLGREKGSGKRIMFGASDGRSYDGQQRWGVSVFDFKMPRADPANPEKAKVDFVGYARIPGLRTGSETVAAAATEEPPKTAEKSSDEGSGTKPSAKSATADESDKPRAKSSGSEGTPKKSSQSSTAGVKKKKGTSVTRKSE